MAQEKWYSPVDIGQHIDMNNVKQEKPPDFAENFEINIDSRYRLLPHIIDSFNKETEKWLEKNLEQYLRKFNENKNFSFSDKHQIELIIKQFSEDKLRIFVVFYFGYARWHHYYILLRDYLIERNDEIDQIFKLNRLEDIYTFSYKGITHGTSLKEMEHLLGSEYHEYIGQSPQLLTVYYENHDLEVVLQENMVKYLQHGKPGWMNSQMYEKHKD